MATKADSEWRTRKEKIDVFLKHAGWNLKDRTSVVEEVDTKQSDFRARNYRTRDDTRKAGEEHAYADYLLLDRSGSPLAIVEAKRTTEDPITGQKQAEDYADDIREQTGKDVFIFLSNGYEIWFWNRPSENPRMVKGFHSREALEILTGLNAGKPVLIEDATRGLQVSLSRRVNKDYKDVEMRVEKIGDMRSIALLKKG